MLIMIIKSFHPFFEKYIFGKTTGFRVKRQPLNLFKSHCYFTSSIFFLTEVKFILTHFTSFFQCIFSEAITLAYTVFTI